MAVELNSAASGNVIKDVFAFGATQIGTTGKYTASEKALFAYNGNKSDVFQLKWSAWWLFNFNYWLRLLIYLSMR